MIITKTNKQAAASRDRRIRANIGCDKCPCCGEGKPTSYYGFFENKGILSGTRKHNIGGFFSGPTTQDCYSCKTCGAEWESDPYPSV